MRIQEGMGVAEGKLFDFRYGVETTATVHRSQLGFTGPHASFGHNYRVERRPIVDKKYFSGVLLERILNVV